MLAPVLVKTDFNLDFCGVLGATTVERANVRTYAGGPDKFSQLIATLSFLQLATCS